MTSLLMAAASSGALSALLIKAVELWIQHAKQKHDLATKQIEAETTLGAKQIEADVVVVPHLLDRIAKVEQQRDEDRERIDRAEEANGECERRYRELSADYEKLSADHEKLKARVVSLAQALKVSERKKVELEGQLRTARSVNGGGQ
jgi:chromosome segregation ATPase